MDLKKYQLYQLKRRDKKITQAAIAEVLGVNQCTISRIEYGKRNVSCELVKKYQRYIDQY